MELLKRQCINLIVDDMVNTDSKDSQIAALAINGLGGQPLKEMSVDSLVDEVWSRCSYMLTPNENEEFAEDDDAFRKWILSQSPKDWCSTTLY